MNNAELPIHPIKYSIASVNAGLSIGLTKREYFAGLAMQRLSDLTHSYTELAMTSVNMADALLKELDKEG